MTDLTPERALIFRITHVDNVPWLLRHGMHCRSSNVYDPGFRQIGNPDLIDKRRRWPVPVSPGGTLGDYVPFYFTSRTPMLANIKSGYNGVPRTPMRDIAILVASLHDLAEQGVSFLITDRHALLTAARFSGDLAHLDRIDWGILQRSDFRRDPNDPGKVERYQAEALVHQHLPANRLRGIISYDGVQNVHLSGLIRAAGLATRVVTRPQSFV